MSIIRIATIRKSGYSEYQLHLLRNHAWFLSESPGTMSFQPDTIQSEKKTKQTLDEYVQGKTQGVNRLMIPN